MARSACDVAAGRVLAHQVVGMAAAHPCRLHPPVGGQVGGPERQALHPGRGAADLLDVGHAPGRLEDGVEEDRALEPGLGLELGDQPVHVVDVLGPLDLGDHDDVELVADLGDGRDQVVEAPRRVQRVDPGPELGGAEVDRPADVDEPLAGGLLVGGRHTVLEVGEQHVHLGGQIGELGHHLRIRRREEVDHPGRPERDLTHGLGRPDGQRAEEVFRGAHGTSRISGPQQSRRCGRGPPPAPTRSRWSGIVTRATTTSVRERSDADRAMSIWLWRKR